MSSLNCRPEPTLAEMLDDPVVRAVMERDGVRPHDIIHLMARMRARLRDAQRRRVLAAA